MMLFPEFDNVQTLYVIGNGFDLHHGMKTSYADFRDYLIHHGHSNLVHQMEQYFPRLVNNKGNVPWNDIENALGEPDIQHIYDDSNEGESIDYDHMMRNTNCKKRCMVATQNGHARSLFWSPRLIVN